MSKKIYQEIQKRILSGTYESGEFIKEKELAEEFGVSRTPIRESLARLEWEKLVTIIPRAGAMVAPSELNTIKEAYQVRFILDGYLGRLAAPRITDAQIAELEALKEECAGLIDQGTQDELNAISVNFRKVLGKAAGNKMLIELSDLLFNISIRVWHSIPDNIAHAELSQALISEIDGCIVAFKAKDADAAEQVMQEAINFYTKKLKNLF